MGGLISNLIDAMLDRLTGWIQDALAWVLGLLSDTVFTSPDVTGLPQVRYAAGNAQLVANAAIVLLVMVAGLLAMAGGGSVQDRYTVKELLPRLVAGFALANLATPIISRAITAANSVTAALAGGRFDTADAFAEIRRVVVAHASPAHFLVAAVLKSLVLVLLAALLLTWLARICVLMILAGVGPVALLCHALPATEPVARVWWRALAACLAVQVLQAVGLHLAVATLLSPQANLPALGLPHDPAGLFNLLVTGFVLVVVIRIPRWVARTFAAGAGGRAASMLGAVLRVVVVQQAMRAVGLRGRRLARRAVPAGIRPNPVHLHRHHHDHQHDHRHEHIRPDRNRFRPDRNRRPGHPPTPSNQPTRRPTPGGTPPRPGAAWEEPWRPSVTPPGVIPLRRPRWQAYGARPSATGWPDPPPSRRPAGGHRSGTGWPGAAPEWKTRRSTTVRRG